MKGKFIAGCVLFGIVLSGGFGMPGLQGPAGSGVFAVAGERQDAAAPETGIPAGLEEAYRLGMNPGLSSVPVVYSIHPCPHCVHLRDFLDRNGVKYAEVYVDDFASPAREQLIGRLESYNSRASYPTLVLPDGRSVVGFREKAVKRLLGLN